MNTLLTEVTNLVPLPPGGPNDNQITLTTGKWAVQLTASQPVLVGVFGPFPGGVVDPTRKAGLGQLRMYGTNVAVGKTFQGDGVYLVELTPQQPTSTTVEMSFNTHKGWAGVWYSFMELVWKFTRPNLPFSG